MKTSDWISVADRMPQDCEDVLVYDEMHGLTIADYEEGYGWTSFEGGELQNVTHWQNIELPK